MTNEKSLSERLRDLFEDVRCDPIDYGPLVAEVECRSIELAEAVRISHLYRNEAVRLGSHLLSTAVEPTRDAEDAARYRCLRSLPAGSWIDLEYSGQPLGGEELDRRVDEAMAQVNRTGDA